MYFRILGSIRVDTAPDPLDRSALTLYGGREIVPLSGRRQQTILAMLLVHNQRTVSIQRMIDAVWTDAPPPATARAQVQNCAAAVRRTLLSARRDDSPTRGRQAIMVTEPNGYRLEADPRSVDAARFADIARGCQQIPADQDHEVIAALRAGLAMWTGPALDGLPSLELQAEAARMEELKLLAVEELASREMRLGSTPAPWAADLRALTLQHPHRERLWLLHMEALRQCGRLTEALVRFREYRTMLIADHGIEPGPEIRAKEREILQSA